MNLDNDSEISLPDVAHQIMRNNNNDDGNDPILDIMRIAPQGRHDQDMALENEMRDFEAAMDFAAAVSNHNDDSIDTTATLSDDDDDDHHHMEIRVSSGSPRQGFKTLDNRNAEKVVEIPSVIITRLDGGGRLNESRLRLLPAVSHLQVAGSGGNVDSGNAPDHGDGQRSPDSLT